MKLPASLAALFAMIATPASAQEMTLYRGGPIVTMDGDAPQTVEAVVTREGRITFVGSEKAATSTGSLSSSHANRSVKWHASPRIAPPIAGSAIQ